MMATTYTHDQKIQEMDYIRFACSDFNGAIRGKVIPWIGFEGAFKSGVCDIVGTQSYGTQGHIPESILQEMTENAFINSRMVADLGTLHVIPWAGNGQHKRRVGQVLCTGCREADLKPLPVDPRHSAIKQLRRLTDLGYDFFSTFEVEAMIYERDTHKPIFPETHVFSLQKMAEWEDLLFEICDGMIGASVPVDCMNTEYAPGQFEFNIKPEFGIKGADNFFKFKHGLKEICLQNNKIANFMAKPDTQISGNGSHFNFSLWDTKTKTNVFYDETKPDNLSDVARYFIGGLQAHTPAMTALCCPTVNCYRRLDQPWAPAKNDWCINDRRVTYRVKTIKPEGSLIENRLPSGACNPYFVIAATLAAGIDGLERHLEPSPQLDKSAEKLPNTLEEALNALDSDSIFKNAIGDKMMDWFMKSKREVDLVELKESNVKIQADTKGIKKELEMYETLC